LTYAKTAKPLTGLVLLEAVSPSVPVELSIAASMAGKIASELGANIVRLSNFDFDQEQVELHSFLNTGKQSINVREDNIIPVIKEHVGHVDCVLTDFDTHGRLDWAELETHSVMISMSIDDPVGGTEFTLEARSGLLDLVGEPDKQPLRLGGHQIPYAAGLASYLAFVDLVAMREKKAKPQNRRVDLLDVAVWLNWKAVGAKSFGLPAPSRQGKNGIWFVVPCKDGYVALVYRSVDWGRILQILDNEQLRTPQFETDLLRRENLSELNSILSQCFSKFTRREIRDLSLSEKLPLGPVLTLKELKDDTHMKARGFFADGKPVLPVQWNGRTFSAELNSSV
jgi:crotonobetainyl-CoA:carnitine CoA-transferase CaiB-like acyl-CoA transferase